MKSNYEIFNADGIRKALITKYAKKWEVMPFVLHPLINDFVLFGGCKTPVFYTVYTQSDLNSLVSNYLEKGEIKITVPIP